MFETHYRPDARLPGMGLGFFRTPIGEQIAVGHQGSHPGFHSHILVAGDGGFAVMAFSNGAHAADLWLPAEVSSLLRRVLGLPEDDSTFASHPAVWADVCGWYRLSAGLSDVRLRGVLGLGAEVFVRGGKLKLRFLTPIPDLLAGFDLLPDDEHDPYLFRADLSESGLDGIGVAFEQDRHGVTTRMHLDLMPLSLDKQPPATNPRRWLAGALAAGAFTLLARRRDGR